MEFSKFSRTGVIIEVLVKMCSSLLSKRPCLLKMQGKQSIEFSHVVIDLHIGGHLKSLHK